MRQENNTRFGCGLWKSRKSWVDFSFCFLLFIASFLTFSPPVIFAQSDEPISFTKKEVGFFKWGAGENEVKLSKIQERHAKVEKGTNKEVETVETTSISWPRYLRIDGNGNIYFWGQTNQIYVLSSNGAVKKIDGENVGGLWQVDGDGSIYAPYHRKDSSVGFFLIKPDGTQVDYKNFNLGHEENGVVYDVNDQAMTIRDNGDKPEKLPPKLFSRPKSRFKPAKLDFGRTGFNSFIIYSKKINEHLKKIGGHIDRDKIQIKIEGDKGLGWTDLIGIDDSGNSYFLCKYFSGNFYEDPFNKASVMLYTPAGQKLVEIPVDLDVFDKRIDGNELAIDIHGNIFQMWASEEGLHIFQWIKN